MNRPSASVKRDWTAAILMCLAVVLLYSPGLHDGETLNALDFYNLHARRMRYADQQLFGPAHQLPGWNSRELLGAPFWSNVQSFPFIPQRLLLLLFNPDSIHTYLLGVQIDAVLAALFTFLFLRRIGLGATASAAAGWTFACCGFFTARLVVAHLPLLDVMPALPLLLWLSEGFVAKGFSRWRFVGLCAAATCLLLAGHPQLPIYAFATAAVYVLWRGGWKRLGQLLATYAIGGLCAAFALVPMFLLVMRSTRVLPMARSSNDIPMPLHRLAGFFLPWLDGAPFPIPISAANPFHGYPSSPWFYETFCYCGWLPWIAAVIVLVLALSGRVTKTQRGHILFFGLLGLIALIASTDLALRLASLVHGTYLRSPARSIYLAEFSLAFFLALGLQKLIESDFFQLSTPLLSIALLIQVWDVSRVSREFLKDRLPDFNARTDAIVQQVIDDAGDQRVGFDITLPSPLARGADDVGYFDSIQLARPYRWLLDLNGSPPDLNLEVLDASQMSLRTLQKSATRYVMTFNPRNDLKLRAQHGDLRIYEVPNAALRAEFFRDDQVRVLSAERIHETLRDPTADTRSVLLMEQPPPAGSSASTPPAKVNYRRIDPDTIDCTVDTASAGVLRLIESYDSGWHATLDGHPMPIIPAETALLAVDVPAGHHEVKLEFRTPGAILGRWISGVSVVLLMLWAIGKRKPDAD